MQTEIDSICFFCLTTKSRVKNNIYEKTANGITKNAIDLDILQFVYICRQILTIQLTTPPPHRPTHDYVLAHGPNHTQPPTVNRLPLPSPPPPLGMPSPNARIIDKLNVRVALAYVVSPSGGQSVKLNIIFAVPDSAACIYIYFYQLLGVKYVNLM